MISTPVVDVSKVWMILAAVRSYVHYVPLAEMFGYSTDLRSRTQGRGNYSMFFEKYEQVPKSVQEKVLSNKNAIILVNSVKRLEKLL